MHRRRGVRRRRIEPTGDRHLGNSNASALNRTKPKQTLKRRKRKRGQRHSSLPERRAETQQKRYLARGLCPQQHAAHATSQFVAARTGLQPAHSLETGAAAACSRFVLRSAAMRLGMVVIRVVRQLPFQRCREALGVVWDEACRGHMLPPHGRSRVGGAGRCLETSPIRDG